MVKKWSKFSMKSDVFIFSKDFNEDKGGPRGPKSAMVDIDLPAVPLIFEPLGYIFVIVR